MVYIPIEQYRLNNTIFFYLLEVEGLHSLSIKCSYTDSTWFLIQKTLEIPLALLKLTIIAKSWFCC